MRNFVNSPIGALLLAMKESEVLVESLGVSVWRMKLSAYALAGVPAAMAGTIATYLTGYIGPESFTLTNTISVLAASVLGGLESVFGAVAGGTVVQLFSEQTSAFSKYGLIAYGVMFVVGGVLFSGGIARLFKVLSKKPVSRLKNRTDTGVPAAA
jgi:branched-chain amino acid transport system permease protein